MATYIRYPGLVGPALTASKAMVSDANGLASTASTTATELGYLSGVTSALQTQMDAKQASLTLPLSITNGGTNSTTALGNNCFAVSSGGKIVEAAAVTPSSALISDSNGLPTASTISSAQLGSVPIWTKYTTSHTALQTGALVNNITLFTLSAKTMIHKVVLKHTTAFAGGSIATYTISIGITGTLTKYIAIFDVMQAVASSTFSIAATTVNAGIEDFSSGVAIKISAISTVANLSASTQGSIDTYVQTSLLP